ncbi:MAG: M13 family metallopeptidase [Muribaculaceae bacterium]|nr:M13 family metallopeptidase [Muribaculaceae bacterium]
MMNDKVNGINKDNLDLSVSPKEDFFKYSCGGWMKANPLTPEYSRFGMFDKLRENAREQLKDLILNLSQDPDAKISGTIAQKVSDLYAMGMDEKRLNEEGWEPLKPLLDRVANADTSRMEEILAWQHGGIGGSFFNTGVGPDAKNSDIYILHIGEVGLGLGDRDFYLEKNERNDEILDAYRIYVKRLMELIGYDEEAQERVWETVIRIETELARHMMTREERRDPMNRFHMMSIEELGKRFPDFNWNEYLRLLNMGDADKTNVANPAFIEFITSYLKALTPQEIKDFMTFETVSDATGLLSDDFGNASFELYGRVMSGQEERKPRWKRAMVIPNSMFGEAVGKLYVEKYFPEENKEYMRGLVENLKTALGHHIETLPWMSEETKAKALDKLSSFTVKIGYPDKWKDYSEIHIDPNKSYLENVLEASKWFNKDNRSKLNKPVDKEEWHMTPQTVNAYYSPISNEICFPAAILQPPYFDPEADDSLNYGAIGVVIGHEMTHGFDDSGRKFDKKGNLEEWWTPEDSERFNDLADKLVEQFDAIEVAPGINANGRFTLGENIADQGGLRIALSAYLDSRNGKEEQDIDGFSPLQRFFIAYANVWAENIREEEVKLRVKTDPHSGARERVNATLRNIDEFHEAFDIREGDAMWRDKAERVVIW